MDPITIGLLVGAGSGILRGIGQKEEAREARKREAEIAKWSPWTGMEAQRVANPNTFDPIMQGALVGAAMGKSYNDSGGWGLGGDKSEDIYSDALHNQDLNKPRRPFNTAVV